MLSGREGAADAHSAPGAPAGSSRTAPCHTHIRGGYEQSSRIRTGSGFKQVSRSGSGKNDPEK
jgi:hypothetical protein